MAKHNIILFYLITFRKHAVISYDDKDKQWSITAMRDCYYCSSPKFNDKANTNFNDFEWISLSKDSKIAVKAGYIISLLQDHSYVYKVTIDDKYAVKNVHSQEERPKNSNENIDSLTNTCNEGRTIK